MAVFMDKINLMEKGISEENYWAKRILSQLKYGSKVSKVREGKHDDILNSSIEFLYEAYLKEGSISKDKAKAAEDMLSGLSEDAKSYDMICCGHAHIDMNWMWRYDETVAITLDTFRTMLNLMDEYPDFIFAQSQASVYRIVEEYDKPMLEEIKARIKEGRWEVTATTWVETDKNMPNGESLARHILYTKKYLSKLLDIEEESLNFDFEPDTFGHSLNVPEICAKGGIKYYYHCRGSEGDNVYRWVAPSSASIIVNREPTWYLETIAPEMTYILPEYSEKYGINTLLKVYGVGDHGGGPTRRDIERIIDMNSWPIFPQIRFGTYAEYFAILEENIDKLPVVENEEQNFVFTGCYSSQSRIKMANRIAEATLFESEAFNAISNLIADYDYSSEDFAKAWEKVLFNHFHDIIPGSGVIDTREHALALFQETMAIANTRKSYALREIASKIDTASLVGDKVVLEETVSEGAGVGFGVEGFRISQTERGFGRTRVFTIFNPSPYMRRDLADITLWDWNYDVEMMEFRDSKGELLNHQVLDKGTNHYWGHSYIRVLVELELGAMGYSTLVLDEAKARDFTTPPRHDPRIELPDSFILENDLVYVEISPMDGRILSFKDKETDEELISKDDAAGVFRFILEDETKGMTSWWVGPYMNVDDLRENVRIKAIDYGENSLRQALSLEMEFENSRLRAKIYLDKNSSFLNYDVKCNWHEIGKAGYGIPQLAFHLPLAFKSPSYKYDIPFGTIERDPIDMDVPANSFAVALPESADQRGMMLVSDSKYGYRGYNDSLSITLIRSSFDPDPYPEIGEISFKLGLSPVDTKENGGLIEKAFEFNHPFNVVSTSIHDGYLEAEDELISIVDGSIELSAIKLSEGSDDGSKNFIIRVYETEGKDTRASIKLFKAPLSASYVDINENYLGDEGIDIKDKELSFDVSPNSLTSLSIKF